MRRRIHAFESSIKGSIKTAFRELDVLLADTVADANDREGAVALEGEGSHIDYSIKGGATVITSLSEHGIAAQSKLLQEGDELLAVNGRPVTDQQHGTLLLREGEGEICLRVCLRPALVEVDLFKPQLSSKLGITLSNGDGADGGNTTIVSALADEGIAANSSAAVHLSTGVELRSVNGRPVLNHEQGTQLLKEACGHISLCVRTRPVTKDVRLFKPQQSSVLGITLTSLDGASILLEPVRLVEAPEPSVSASVALQMAPPTTRQQEVLLVDWVHRAAGAERVACSSCRGDACMAGVARAQSHGLATGMDGSLEEATPTELAWSLESPWASSRAVLFDIRTAAALERAWSEGAGAVLHITTPCDRREQEMVVDLTAMRATLISSGAELRVVRTSRCGSSSSDAPREAPPRIIAMQRGQSFDLGAWCAALPTGSECAPLIRRVALYKADRHSKLGITLTDDIRGVTTIAALDPDGIAARSGQAALAPADEVISVDGESVRGHAHATHLLKRACGEIVLRCRTPRAPLYSEAELQRMSEDDQLRAALMASQVQADAVEEPIRQRRRRALAKATPGDGVDARLIFSEDDERDRAELDPCSQCSVCSGAGIVSSLVEADAAAEIPCTIAGAEVPDYRCAVCDGEGAWRISAECPGQHYFCAVCIEGTLTASLESGQLPLHCPCCRAEATSTVGRVESALSLPGRVTDESLSLLQLRGVISRRLMFRLINAARSQTMTTAVAEFSPCPADCGRFHLNEHESYTSEAAGRRIGLGEVVAVGGAIGLRLSVCECGALICHACKALVDPADATAHMCKQGGATVDPASKALLAKVCKACPGCGMLQQKTDGCALMMCGTVAHGRVADALRNGGCAYIFHWDTLEPQVDDHGYIGLDEQMHGVGVVTERQVLKKYEPSEAELLRLRTVLT